MNDHLFVIATIIPRDIFFDRARDTILGIVERTLEEPGCRQFSVHQEDNALYLYEEWDSQEDLDKHYAMPYIQPIFEAYEEWLEKPVQIHKLTKLA